MPLQARSMWPQRRVLLPLARQVQLSTRTMGAATEKQVQARMARLRARLRRYDLQYFLAQAPTVSDATYDQVAHELAAYEAAHPKLGPFPVRDIEPLGPSSTARVQHVVPMHSLDKGYSLVDWDGFDARVRRALANDAAVYVGEPKVDGIALTLTYSGGRLLSAATRGDGHAGETVLHHALTIPDLPLHIPLEDTVHVRGEAYMLRTTLVQVNASRTRAGLKPFVSCRNAAAGILALLPPLPEDPLPATWLRFFSYQLIQEVDSDIKTQLAALGRLRTWGFAVQPDSLLLEDQQACQQYWYAMRAARHARSYDTDGVVYKLDSLSGQCVLGNTARTPRWALALKFQPDQALTRLQDMMLQVGRSGTLTPVARLEPVVIDDVCVTRASLHNFDVIQRKDVRVGDVVLVQRAGDVIPKVVGVDIAQRPASSLPFNMPTHCPSCSTELTRDGPYIRCPAGLRCPDQLQQTVLHYSSRQALNIQGFGPNTVKNLIASGLVRSLADLHRLPDEAMVDVGICSASTARRLTDSIQASCRQTTLANFLHGLGLPQLGYTKARRVAAQARTLATLLSWSAAELAQVPGISLGAATMLYARLQEDKQDIEFMWDCIERSKPPAAAGADQG